MTRPSQIFLILSMMFPLVVSAEMKPTPLQVTLTPKFREEMNKDTDFKKFEMDQVRDFAMFEDAIRSRGWKVTMLNESATQKIVYRRAKGETVDQVVYKLVDSDVCSRAECRKMLEGMNRGKSWDKTNVESALAIMIPVRSRKVSIDAGPDYQENKVTDTKADLKIEAVISTELLSVFDPIKDRARLPVSSKNCANGKCENFHLKMRAETAAGARTAAPAKVER